MSWIDRCTGSWVSPRRRLLCRVLARVARLSVECVAAGADYRVLARVLLSAAVYSLFTVCSQVLTTGYWPAYPPAPLKIPKELLDHLEAFEKFYLSKHQGRRLTWQVRSLPLATAPLV